MAPDPTAARRRARAGHDGVVVGPSRVPSLVASGAAELDLLRGGLERLGGAVVAFSGGADSSLLAWVAHEVLGDRALAVTAASPSLPAAELEACRELAASWGMAWCQVATQELDDPRYAANDGDRCYWCKDALLAALAPVAAARQATVCLGVNLDDLDDHRPGQRAARERGAAFPLVDAGLTKARVRALSRELGLATWDKPAAACLASRLPYGTPVTLGRLAAVERAEAALRALGWTELRVRHHGDVARIEVPEHELEAVVARRAEVRAAVVGAGYRWVALDLGGLRSGGFNQLLR
jgi:pyridinium-3,5-biscarboxylic acid mononucleotide sulfurtransferase